MPACWQTISMVTASFADLDITGGTIGISVLNGSTGTLDFGAPSSIAGTSGVAFSIDGSAPTVTYNGTITQTSAASAVDINAMTGGTRHIRRADQRQHRCCQCHRSYRQCRRNN